MNKILALIFHLWILGGLLEFFCFSFTTSLLDYQGLDVPAKTHIDIRFAEVEKHCSSVISSASELTPDDNRRYRLQMELSFHNGDWEQETGGSPLMPFNDNDMPKNSSSFISPYKLVSFAVTNMDPIWSTQNMVTVSGVMSIGITRDSISEYKSYKEFCMSPGVSTLGIVFEGVYVEKNGGERLLCLMGKTSALPSFKGLIDAGKSVEGDRLTYNYQPTLLEDDQILLVLHYPRIFTLTTRAIHGEMRSLREESDLKYFDKVQISSQLGQYSEYQFGSEGFMSKAYTLYSNHDDWMDDGIKFSNASMFCRNLKKWTAYYVYNIVPNWKCNNRDDYCSKLGHFGFESEIWSMNRSFDSVRLIMQNVRCKQETYESNFSNARVAVVFRLIPSSAKQDTEAARTGIGMTLLAEGIWNLSSSELCMVGCLGGSDRCDSQVCLYFPHQFSVKQRSFMSGSVSSIVHGTGSYSFLFEKVLQSADFVDHNWYIYSQLSYKYSKIELARNFLERSQSPNFKASITKSLVSNLTPKDGGELYFLYCLSKELSLRVFAVPDPLPIAHPWGTRIEMKVISLGPLFGSSPSELYGSQLKKNPFNAQDAPTKNHLLNVSAYIQFIGKSYNNLSLLSVEGLYDPIVGKMYLIGCRDVRGLPKILFKSMDLEDGRDCLIEVKIQYPSLINRIVKISIASQRNKDNPLHFSRINLQTRMISYEDQTHDIFFRRNFEGILRILMLSAMVVIILKQLSYIRDKADVVPYVSLTMLGIQILGYSLPLISDAEILFKWKVSQFGGYRSYNLENDQWLDFAKLILPFAIIFTLSFFQNVRKSRLRIPAPKPGKFLNEKHVFIITLFLHVFGFIIAHIVHRVNVNHMLLEPENFELMSANATSNFQKWVTEIEKYVALVQDFFLLPQIIGNFLWEIHGKPLCKSYYIGFTILRLLLNVYDIIRDPICNPYSHEDERIILMHFLPSPGIISIPLTLVVLAITVYIQQRRNYQKLRQTIKMWQCKLLRSESKNV
ncbi:Protein of unknown function DUF2921 [Macleaya cordata]|uniref:RING-type E3 ubiquitin transferase n=1 Tax=Macleaya cordata TaxID=56857 RepID=A0A200Q7Y5_MACCD|nr:Protein of unknown function DUF2921 [Macleaya cordata]